MYIIYKKNIGQFSEGVLLKSQKYPSFYFIALPKMI